MIVWAGLIIYSSSYARPEYSPAVSSVQREIDTIDIPNVSIRPMLPKFNPIAWFTQLSHWEYNRRILHLLLYLVFGFLTVRALNSTTMRHENVIGFAVGIVFALSDEIHQIYVPGRSFEWLDILSDVIGILTGIILFRCLSSWWIRLQLKKSKPLLTDK